MKKTITVFICLVLVLCTVLGACNTEHGNISEPDNTASEGSTAVDASKGDASQAPSAEQSEATGDVSFPASDDTTEDTDPSYTAGSYVYKLTNDVAKLVGYTGSETELELPSELDGHALTAIDSGAFANCDKLEKLTVGDSVVNIADGAFSGCTALKYLRLGSSVAVFNPQDLSGLAALAEISVSNANSGFSTEYGVLYSGDKTKLLFCPRALKADSLKVPASVTLIESYAFAECSSLKKVQLPDNCLLSAFSFFHCTSLESVVFASGHTSIPEKCFFGCVKLKEIAVPEGVTEIGRLAFFGCVALSSASIPSSVTAIGDDVFKCCSALKRITVKGEYATAWYTETGKSFINQ